MKKVHIFLMAVCLSVLLLSGFSCRSQTRADYPYQPVTFTSVHFSDAFWLPRLETNRKVTIPFALDQSEETGRLKNFEIAGGAAEGEFCSIYPFDDSDVYKIIEGASYALNIRNDPELEGFLDELIAKIAAAQEEDGYLYTGGGRGRSNKILRSSGRREPAGPTSTSAMNFTIWAIFMKRPWPIIWQQERETCWI